MPTGADPEGVPCLVNLGGIDVKNGSLGTAEFARSIPGVHATRSTSQIIPDGSTFTPIAFDEERYDTASMHSNLIISNNSRLTAPVDGIYELTAAVLWGTSDDETRAMGLRRNGTTLLAHENVPAAGGDCSPNSCSRQRCGWRPATTSRLWLLKPPAGPSRSPKPSIR
jgi:hypothetical protein